MNEHFDVAILILKERKYTTRTLWPITVLTNFVGSRIDERYIK